MQEAICNVEVNCRYKCKQHIQKIWKYHSRRQSHARTIFSFPPYIRVFINRLCKHSFIAMAYPMGNVIYTRDRSNKQFIYSHVTIAKYHVGRRDLSRRYALLHCIHICRANEYCRWRSWQYSSRLQITCIIGEIFLESMLSTADLTTFATSTAQCCKPQLHNTISGCQFV